MTEEIKNVYELHGTLPRENTSKIRISTIPSQETVYFTNLHDMLQFSTKYESSQFRTYILNRNLQNDYTTLKEWNGHSCESNDAEYIYYIYLTFNKTHSHRNTVNIGFSDNIEDCLKIITNYYALYEKRNGTLTDEEMSKRIDQLDGYHTDFYKRCGLSEEVYADINKKSLIVIHKLAANTENAFLKRTYFTLSQTANLAKNKKSALRTLSRRLSD